MAITVSTYAYLPYYLATGQVDTSAPFKVLLTDNSYSPNIYGDVTAGSVRPFQVSGPGYTADGADISPTWTIDVSNRLTKLVIPGNTTTWPTATFAVRFAVVYQYLSAAPDDGFLYAVADLGATQTPVGEDFVLQWSSDGIVNFRSL